MNHSKEENRDQSIIQGFIEVQRGSQHVATVHYTNPSEYYNAWQEAGRIAEQQPAPPPATTLRDRREYLADYKDEV